MEANTKTNPEVDGLNQSDADHTKHHDPDVELMLAFQAGDEQAFITLYDKYRDRLVNYARRFLVDRARGEEAAQDVFLKIYRARLRYQPMSRFSTYLFLIATNHCLNMVQRHDQKLVDRATELSERPGALLRDGSASPEEAYSQTELRGFVNSAIGRLAENQRAAFLLCHYQGMSYREAAEVIEVTEGAVKSLIHRAREKLAKELAPLRAQQGGA